MIDFFMAMLGTKHCRWCNYKKDNLIERYAGGFRSERDTFKRFVWWIYTHAGLGMWRFGQRWHWRYHV